MTPAELRCARCGMYKKQHRQKLGYSRELHAPISISVDPNTGIETMTFCPGFVVPSSGRKEGGT